MFWCFVTLKSQQEGFKVDILLFIPVLSLSSSLSILSTLSITIIFKSECVLVCCYFEVQL